MKFVKKDKKSVTLKTFELQKPKTSARNLRQIKNPKGKNLSLFSFIGTTLLACNTSTDDQCYGGLGVIVGSLCANKNNLVNQAPAVITNGESVIVDGIVEISTSRLFQWLADIPSRSEFSDGPYGEDLELSKMAAQRQYEEIDFIAHTLLNSLNDQFV